MKFAIITGESFFKTSSHYIARLIASALAEQQHEIFVINKTKRTANLSQTKTLHTDTALIGILPKSILERKKINSHLKQLGIDKILIFDPADIIKTTVPQTLILNSRIDTVEDLSKRMMMATNIITFSETEKQRLSAQQPELNKKIRTTKAVIDAGFREFTYNERLGAKEQFAEEKEYFLNADLEMNEAQFLNLLKAFSAFKKMQQSNWKLVVYLRQRLATKELEALLQPLSNFKYRQDVNIINFQNDITLPECMAGAYALISTAEKTTYNLPVLEALVCNTPCVALRSEIFNDYPELILEATNNAPESFAEKMMFLYKNETKRSDLSQQANTGTKEFNARANLNALITK